MNTKTCTHCKKELSIDKFRLRKKRKGTALVSYCVDCERSKNKTYYEKNKEKMKADAARYYWNNRESALKNVRQYREKNRSAIREKGRNYYRSNIGNRLLNGARARAKKKKLPFDLTADHINMLLEETLQCPLLGIKLDINDGNAGPSSYSLDRIFPDKGYVQGNVQIISHRANTLKSDSSLAELELLVKNWRSMNMKVSND